MKYVCSFLLPVVMCFSCVRAGQGMQEVKSPESAAKVTFNMTSDGRPYYQVYYQNKLVIDTSLLGLDLNKSNDLIRNFEDISRP